jgi:hypothetical protein
VPISTLPLLAAAALSASAAPDTAGPWTPSEAALKTARSGEVFVEVLPDSGPSGRIHAVVDIQATPAAVRAMVLDCDWTRKLVRFVKACRTIEEGQDGTWDVREHRIDYGFFLPRIRHVFRQDFEGRRIIRFRCLPQGGMKFCEGVWRFEPLSGGRAVRLVYEERLTAPFPVPGFIIRIALKRDVTTSMRALKRGAEAPPV